MPVNDYHSLSHWRLSGTVQEVYDILAEPKDLPRWWPSVYLDVLEIQSGGPDDVLKVVRLESKGRLPYKLNWHFTVTESDPPHGFAIKTWGDFEGTGRWTLEQDGEFVNVTYDWCVSARKPVLRYGSMLFKPIFALDHRWTMARGEDSLKLELRRRRAEAGVPPPPGPAPMPPLSLVLGFGALAVAAFAAVRLASRGARPDEG